MEEKNGKTILLVDNDDKALLSSLAFILRIEGYTLRTYGRGRELLDDLDPPEHSCLVVDQRLPDSKGWPSLLITTNPTRALRRRAEEAEGTIVEKPLITGTLFERIVAAQEPRPDAT